MPDESRKMTNYGGNAHKQKAEAAPEEPREKKVERVTTGEVIRAKKPLGRKIAETFKGDDVHSVGTYVLFEVVLPQVKTAISDAVSQGIERMLFGDSRPSRSTSRGGFTPYNRYSGSSSSSTARREEPRVLSSRERAQFDFSGVILKDRIEAEKVLDGLVMLIDQFDRATVADMWDLVGETPAFTDNKWGWLSVASAGIRRVSGGFLVDLPAPEQLD